MQLSNVKGLGLWGGLMLSNTRSWARLDCCGAIFNDSYFLELSSPLVSDSSLNWCVQLFGRPVSKVPVPREDSVCPLSFAFWNKRLLVLCGDAVSTNTDPSQTKLKLPSFWRGSLFNYVQRRWVSKSHWIWMIFLRGWQGTISVN